MKRRIKQTLLGILTVIVVTLGVAVWNTRPIAAQEPPMDPSYRAWCQRVHAELFSMLPEHVQQTLMTSHGHRMH